MFKVYNLGEQDTGDDILCTSISLCFDPNPSKPIRVENIGCELRRSIIKCLHSSWKFFGDYYKAHELAASVTLNREFVNIDVLNPWRTLFSKRFFTQDLINIRHFDIEWGDTMAERVDDLEMSYSVCTPSPVMYMRTSMYELYYQVTATKESDVPWTQYTRMTLVK